MKNCSDWTRMDSPTDTIVRPMYDGSRPGGSVPATDTFSTPVARSEPVATAQPYVHEPVRQVPGTLTAVLTLVTPFVTVTVNVSELELAAERRWSFVLVLE